MIFLRKLKSKSSYSLTVIIIICAHMQLLGCKRVFMMIQKACKAAMVPLNLPLFSVYLDLIHFEDAVSATILP